MSLDIYLEMYVDFGGPDGPKKIQLFSRNITHNLIGLWKHIKVYDALYMSDGDLAEKHYPSLVVGVDHMLERPDECQQLDAPNGWGTYKDALPWLCEVVEAFRQYPKATIRISK